jgi:hypothetical protein
MNDFITFYIVSLRLRAISAVAGVVAVTATGLSLGQAQVVPAASAIATASTNITGCTCIREVILRVYALPINPQQRAPLLKTLEQARRRIAVCHAKPAGKRMIKFARQTQQLVGIGVLDQPTADSLAVCARTIDLCRSGDCDVPAANLPPGINGCTCLREVILRVYALPINPQQLPPLLQTLEQARRRIAVCQGIVAGGRMLKFVKQTQKLVGIGLLDQPTADSLDVCARTIDLCRIGDCDVPAANLPPVVLAKPLVLSADAQCQADVPASQFDNGSFDPDGVIVNRSITPPGPYPLGETPVTYTVVDNGGLVSSMSTSVLVKDTTGPSVSNFSPNFLIMVTPGQTSGTAIFPVPVVSDSCSGVAAVSFSPPSGSVFPIGITPVVLIVVDHLGNTNQIPFNVVALANYGGGGSNLPPVAIAHAVTNAADANCQAVVTANQVDKHSFDPDGTIVSRIVEPAGPFPVNSVTPVTLTVVDNQGASSSAATTVTVLDLTPPSFITPPQHIVVTPAPGQQSVVVNYPTLSVVDNCSATAVGVNCTPPPGTAFGLGTNTVTCEVIDWSGNTDAKAFRVIVNGFDATACDTIAGLIERVEAIPLTGHFNGRRQTGLVKKLLKTQQNIELNRLRSADHRLGGFIRACSIYMSLDVLHHRIAYELIACATNIKNHLGDEQ